VGQKRGDIGVLPALGGIPHPNQQTQAFPHGFWFFVPDSRLPVWDYPPTLVSIARQLKKDDKQYVVGGGGGIGNLQQQ
jgi:hypothetical protein